MQRPRLAYIVTDSVSTGLLKGQLRLMVEEGFDVTVISSPGEKLDRCAVEEGVRTVAVPMARPIRPWQDLRSLVLLFFALRALRPHVVNAGTPKAALLGMMASWVLRVPVRIYIVRGLRLETVGGTTRRVLALTERITSFCSTHILYVSKSLRQTYEALRLGPVRKGVVLGEGSSKGVDVARFRKTPARVEAAAELRRKVGIPEGAQVAGFVGRFTKDKGIEELVAAFSALEPAHPDLHLLLVGQVEEDDRPSAETLRTIETHPKIHRSGVLQDVSPAYQAMDFLLLPSYREGFPNVVLEASSAGRPTIGFRSTGVRDAVVEGETGQLVPVGDAAALAEAMATYLRAPEELAARHGAAALARVERVFAQEKVFEAVAGLYRAALAAHPDTSHLLMRLAPLA